MALFDFLKNRNSNEIPQIKAVTINELPKTEYPLPVINEEQGNNNNLYNRIRGLKDIKDKINLFDTYENPTDESNYVTTDENGNTLLNSAIGNPTIKNRGFLNDLDRGFKENYNNGFQIDNWQDKQTGNMPKNFASRIGEGLGSVTRLMAGLGGDAYTAGTRGLDAALQRQNIRTNDQLYRNALKDYGIDTSNIKGYVDKDMFNNIANNAYKQSALQVRQAIAGQTDNTKRASMIMNGLKSGMITPDEAKGLMDSYGITINDLRDSNETQLLPYKQFALQTAPQVALGNLGVAQGNLGLAQDRYNLEYLKFLEDLKEKNNPKPDKAVLNALSDNQKTIADIDAGLKLIEKNPQAYSYFKGKVGADIANRIDPKGVPTRTQIDNITAVYRKWLTGAQMSDAERKAYERFLPAPTDNARIVKAKLQGMRDSIQRQNDVIMNTYGNINMPASNINSLNVDTSALNAELKRRGL